MIKLILSDMDGTLLDEQGRLPVEFAEVAAELKERGVLFAPCSGRQYFSLLDTFAAYRDEFLFLAENGTMACYQGKELFSCPMPRAQGMAVIETVRSVPRVASVYCGKKNAYVLRDQYTSQLQAELDKYYTQSAIVDDFAEIEDEIIKASFYDAAGDAENNIFSCLEKFSSELQVALSSNYWVDVMRPDINKGAAVQRIQQMFAIAPEECAAFGDYLNDVEFMQSVSYSFAVANAHPAIKKLARFETGSNADHGVITGIRKLIADGLCG